MAWTLKAMATGTPATEIRNEIEALMPAAGWQLVDDWTLPATGWNASTSGTMSVTNGLANASQHVWKNPAANNSAGVDFFISLTTPTNGLGLAVGISEGYDVPTHKATKYAPLSGSTTVTMNADGTFAAGDRGFGEGNVNPRPWVAGHDFTGVSDPYAIVVTNDVVLMSCNLLHFVLGRIEPIGTPLATDTLLFVASGTSSTTTPYNNGASSTRSPLRTGSQQTSVFFGAGYAYGPEPSALDAVTGQPRAQRRFLTDNRGTDALRGLAPHTLILPVSGTIGDTLTVVVNGVTRYYMRGPHGTSRIWLEKV